MDRSLACDYSMESSWAALYCGSVCFYNFTQFVNLTPLDLDLSGVKGLTFQRFHLFTLCLYSLNSFNNICGSINDPFRTLCRFTQHFEN